MGHDVIFVIGGHQQGIGGPLPGATFISDFLASYRDGEGRPEPFGGRENELRRLDEWLGTAGQPYLLLTGLPGRGKSALLSRWCDRLAADGGSGQLRIVFVPISIRFDFNRQETVLSAIATRLAGIHGELAFGESTDRWRDLIGEFLQREPPSGTRVLVVLDGLDEAGSWRVGPWLLPKSPHPEVKVVVSARLTATHPGPDAWLQDLGVPQTPVMVLNPLDEQGVREVLLHMGLPADDPGAVARLHHISGGDPLVVGLYSGYLRDNPPPPGQATDDWLQGANPGIDGFIDRWWDEQKQLRPAAAASSGRVFNLLACAFGPIERGDLLDLARRSGSLSGDELDAALDALDRLVIATGQDGYAVAHPRVLERRLSRLRKDRDLKPIEQAYIEWAAQSSQRTDGPPSPYIVRHRGQHLERAQEPPEQMIELLSPAWRSGWLTVADDVTGWIDDIDRVHAAASRADAAAIGAGSQPRWTALRAWCTCLRAEAGASYDLIDGAFARVLVESGLWSERRALTRCAYLEKTWERAEYLTALAPSLGRDGARMAAQLARTLEVPEEEEEEASLTDTEEASEAVAAVAARLVANDDLSVAQELLDGIRFPAVRAAGVIATFQALSGDDRVAALRSLGDDGTGADIVQLAPRIEMGLARRAFGDQPWRYLEGQLRRQDRWWPAATELDELDAQRRAIALECLAPWMTSDELEQHVTRCIDALAASNSPFGVNEVIAHLAPCLKDKDAAWHRARTIAHDLLRDHPAWQLEVDSMLLPYAPPESSAPLVEQLAESVPQLLEQSNSNNTPKALCTLAAGGASGAILSALAEWDESKWFKAEYLASVAPYLSPAEVSRALDIAANTRRDRRPTALTALLTQRARCGDADAALAAATGPSDPDDMAAALAVLRIASGGQSFSQAITALIAIEDRPLRVAAAAVAARLALPAGADLLRLVRSLGDALTSTDGLSMEMFASVASEIRGEDWADAAALRTAAYVISEGKHPRKPRIMVEHYQRFAEARGVEEALDQARLHCEGTWDLPLACAVTAVAPRLTPEMPLDRNELVSQSSEHAPVVKAATLGLLPPARRGEFLGYAIQGLGNWAEVRSDAAALLLGAVPEELYESAASVLISDALLDGPTYFAPPLLWPYRMTELCGALDQSRLQRLLVASRRRSSEDGGTERSGRRRLRAAIAARLAELGEVDAALECLGDVDPKHAATALQQMAGFVPAARIPQLLEVLESRVEHTYWRGPLALAAAALGRRMSELPQPELSRLLDRWHARAPQGGEVLVGLLAYGPALRTLGGADSVRDLADRLAAL